MLEPRRAFVHSPALLISDGLGYPHGPKVGLIAPKGKSARCHQTERLDVVQASHRVRPIHPRPTILVT